MTATTERFDFLPHWYPVSPLEDLDPSRPTAVPLLGRRFVVWKAGGGRIADEPFRVFLDLCPHRLAPLSEGRVDPATGRLMCSYHGWQFDGEGLCRRIPQAAPAEPADDQARQYCATTLPSRQAQGLLWIWPDAATAARAAGTPLPLSDRVDAAAGFVWSSVVRDLPYDWVTLVENVADPSHVPFAHHGVQGNRGRAFPIPMRMAETGRDLLEARVETPAMAITIRFQPPCLLEYRFDLARGGRMGLVTYCLPVAPGRSRIVAQFPRDFARWQMRLVPRWWDHVSNRNEVLDGDAVLLHLQERELEARRFQGDGAGWQAAYHLPTAADRLVVAFRRWHDRWGGPDWASWLGPGAAVGAGAGTAEVPALLSERLLDRYHQHTLLCSSCRGALRTIRRLQGLALLPALPALAVAALLPDALRLRLGLPLVLLALAGVVAAVALRWGLEPRFRYRPYDHTRR
ncbi:MAG: Rieske 2Fe-2S domain-containing protein [Synechococcaceae cyanobacterium]|nr:Rieske 2Fe-2S domain-containing protein [Synechococcaceae cyanobacterium]